MKTRKVTVVLPADLADTLDRLARGLGRTRSSIIEELIEPSKDSITAYADLVEHFQNATPEQLAALVKDAEALGTDIASLNSDISCFKSKASELTSKYNSITLNAKGDNNEQ